MPSFSKQRNPAIKMQRLFPSENDPCDLHRHDFQHCATRHHIEPSLTHLLRFSNGRGNGSNDDQQCADTANDGRHTDKRKQPRCAAAINGVLNGLVQPVPCCRKAAYHKSKHQQNYAPAPPIWNARAAPNRPADKTQHPSGQEHKSNEQQHDISEAA